MLLLTGEAKYADLMERTLYNGFLAGISLDGERYIYANPLQVRDDHVGAGNDQDYARVPWFACACCPPNVMRLLASLEHYVALSGPTELRLHQYVSGTYAADLAAGPVGVTVATDYPWQAGVELTVTETLEDEWSLTVRVPHWAVGATAEVNGEPRGRRRRGRLVDGDTAAGRSGDRLTLDSAGRPPASPSPTPASTPPAAVSRSNAARWSTASRPRTTPATAGRRGVGRRRFRRPRRRGGRASRAHRRGAGAGPRTRSR